MTDEEREFFLKKLPTTTILPGDSLPPDGRWHLCTLERMTCEDKVSNCTVCNRPVYFLNDWPHLDKICPACAMKQKGETRSYTTETAIAKFLLHDKRN